ncbi:MAG: ABC transporter ATP-binding protein [Chloroflexota bacterium]
MSVIRLAGVSVRRAGRTILGPLDWEVGRGQRWVVLGPNGSGKSTLLQVVDLATRPTTGTVDVLGARLGRIDAREHRRRIGYAASSVEETMNPGLTPVDLVMSARHGALEPWWHSYEPADRQRAADLLDRLGVGGPASRPLQTLSTGERRRVSIARALMPEPDLLLLDEPAAGLDLAGREELIGTLARLARDDALHAIVLVTHHVEEIPPAFGHALVLPALRDGPIPAGPIEQVLSPAVLSRAYGLAIDVERRDGRFTARARVG